VESTNSLVSELITSEDGRQAQRFEQLKVGAKEMRRAVDPQNECIWKELQAVNCGPLFYTRVDGYGGQWAKPSCFDVVINSSPKNKPKGNLVTNNSNASSAKNILQSAKWKKVETVPREVEEVKCIDDISKIEFELSDKDSILNSPRSNTETAADKKVVSAGKELRVASPNSRISISESERRLKQRYSALKGRENVLDRVMDVEAEVISQNAITARNTALLNKLSSNNLVDRNTQTSVNAILGNTVITTATVADQQKFHSDEYTSLSSRSPQTRFIPSDAVNSTMFDLGQQKTIPVGTSETTPEGAQTGLSSPLTHNLGLSTINSVQARNFAIDDFTSLDFRDTVNSKFQSAITNVIQYCSEDDDSDEEAVRRDINFSHFTNDKHSVTSRLPWLGTNARDLGFSALRRDSIGTI
jgi:hypothetical protein